MSLSGSTRGWRSQRPVAVGAALTLLVVGLALGSGHRAGAVAADGGPSFQLGPIPAEAVRAGTVRLVVGGIDEDHPADAVTSVLGRSATVVDSVPVLGAVTIEVPVSQAQSVATRLDVGADVGYVEVEGEYRADRRAGIEPVTPSDPWYDAQDEMRAIDAPHAWARTTGSADVVVAVVDSGVTANSDLRDIVAPPGGSPPGTPPTTRSAVLAGYDFVNGDSDPADDFGHGTEVATTLAGRGDNGVGIAGVCWACRILPVKVLDSDGVGNTTTIAQGITWAVDHGASVVNLSLGGPTQSNLLDSSIDYAIAHGAVVVASVGNHGDDRPFPQPTDPQYPAASPGTLSVGSVGTDGEMYPLSGRGAAWVDVAAPNRVVSLRPDDDSAYYFEGTSAAAPLVSGTAALVRSLHPGWSVTRVVSSLTETAHPLGMAGLVASGMLDAGAATAWAPSTPPTTTTTTTTAPATTTSTTGVSSTAPVLPPDAPPRVSVQQPASFISGVTTTRISASDDHGVTGVTLLVGGAPVTARPAGGDTWTASWDSRDQPEGALGLTAIATDSAGHRSGAPGITVTVDNRPPLALVWGPDGQTRSSTFGVVLLANDLGVGTKATLLIAEGRWVGLLIGNGFRAVDVPVTRNGPIRIAAITVDYAGHAAFSNLVTVQGSLRRGRSVRR